jgi:CheY-like chemotaxis protein
MRFRRMSAPPQPLALVVDDEELLRLHAAGLLEDHGFTVIEAENAEAALKALETHDQVRLLFADVQMPGALDEMDLARQVHARCPNVLLVITSGRQKPTRAEIPDDGRFVAKPYRGGGAFRRSGRSDAQRSASLKPVALVGLRRFAPDLRRELVGADSDMGRDTEGGDMDRAEIAVHSIEKDPMRVDGGLTW